MRYGPNECYEANAKRFYKDTHLMAPGKSVPFEIALDNESERREAWEKWKTGKNWECICGKEIPEEQE